MKAYVKKFWKQFMKTAEDFHRFQDIEVALTIGWVKFLNWILFAESIHFQLHEDQLNRDPLLIPCRCCEEFQEQNCTQLLFVEYLTCLKMPHWKTWFSILSATIDLRFNMRQKYNNWICLLCWSCRASLAANLKKHPPTSFPQDWAFFSRLLFYFHGQCHISIENSLCCYKSATKSLSLNFT